MQMKTYLLKGFLAAAFVLTVSACSKDNSGDVVSDGPMKFSSVLPQVKATDLNIQSVQIDQGVEAGVSVGESEELFIDKNVKLTADGKGSFASSMELFWPGEAAYVYAYAPYDSSWKEASLQTFTIASDQSTDEGYLASDLILGAPVVNPVPQTAEVVPLVFEHMMAKVNVTVQSRNEDVILAGATLSIVDVLPSVSVDVVVGTIGQASGDPVEIKMATFASDAVEFKASALIVPQTLSAGDFLKIQAADGITLTALLSEDVEFKGGKRYTYTVRISENSVSLLVGTSVEDWEDDDQQAGGSTSILPYEIGDYVLADGGVIRASDLASATDEQKQNIAGVVFCTEVSAADEAAGYAGYAMSVWGRKGSQTWMKQTGDAPLKPAVTSTSAAFADLDGLAFASLVEAADPEYTNYTAFNFSNYSSQKIALTGENLSGWYMPSFGQMARMLNNLAGAQIDLTTDYVLSGGGEYKDTSHPDLVARLNSYISAVNPDNADFSTSDQFFATTTEHDATRIWGFKLTASGYTIASIAGKTNGGRNVIPVFAYKLPTE